MVPNRPNNSFARHSNDTMTTSELPGRLFDALVSEIYTNWPEYVHSRFTVAEIYQNLIPWRTHRDTMDIADSGEYDQALLRLLAGEGDYLAIESKAARDEIQAELECRFPNTGIYRDFAAVGVRLNPSRLPVHEDGAGRQEASSSAATEGNGFGAEQNGPEAGAASPAAPAPDRTRPDEAESAGRACLACSHELPRVEGMRFCPFCGQNARVVACVSCGMRVEAEWSYCVGCGTRARRD